MALDPLSSPDDESLRDRASQISTCEIQWGSDRDSEFSAVHQTTLTEAIRQGGFLCMPVLYANSKSRDNRGQKHAQPFPYSENG